MCVETEDDPSCFCPYAMRARGHDGVEEREGGRWRGEPGSWEGEIERRWKMREAEKVGR